MNKNTIDSALKYLIFFGLFLIPFVFLLAPSDPGASIGSSNIFFFANHFFFPFITSKGFVFRIIVEVIFALWLALMLRDKKYLPRFSWMSIAITVFTVAILISDLFGVNPIRSIWSNFERMEGWMMIIHIWAYFMILVSVFTDRKNWNQLFNVNLFVAFWIGVYGVAQLTGHAQIHQGSTRLDASLGNAEYLAVYMLFQAFIAAYMFFANKKKGDSPNVFLSWVYSLASVGVLGLLVEFIFVKFNLVGLIVSVILAVGLGLLHRWKKSLMPNVPQWIYSLLFGFLTFILFETATRGTILGISFAGIFVFVYYALFARGVNYKKILWLVSVGLILFVVGLLYFFHPGADYLLVIAGIVVAIYDVLLALYVYKDNKYLQDPHVAAGRWVSIAILTILILGGGLFYVERNSSFIQHNDVLQRIASISLQDTQTQARAYIWPMAIKGAFQSPKTALIGWGQENFNYIFNANYNPLMWNQEQWFDRAHSVPLDWLVAGGLIGMLIYLSFFVFALVSLIKSNLSLGQKAVLVGLLAAYGIHIIFVFDNLASYVLFATILAFITSLHKTEPYAWLEKKIDLSSENFGVIRDYAVMPILLILLVVTIYYINVQPMQANLLLVDALESCQSGGTPTTSYFSDALALNKYMANQEIREQLISCASSVIPSNVSDDVKADFFSLTTQQIQAQIKATPNDARAYLLGGSFYNDIVGDYTTALPILEKAHELSPAKQTIDFQLAAAYMNIGSTTQAVDLMKMAYESATNNSDAKEGYITALILDGQEKEAYALFGDEPDLFLDQRVINVYAKLKDYPKIVSIYKQLIVENPQTSQNYLSLTAAYLYENDLSDAEAELKLVENMFPETVAQVDPVLKQIEAGKNPLPQPPQ